MQAGVNQAEFTVSVAIRPLVNLAKNEPYHKQQSTLQLQHLPDKYIISSLFFLTLICIWHGGIAVIEKVAQRFDILLWADMELYVILLIGIGYFTFNVGFMLMIYCVEKVKCQMNKKGSRAHRATNADIRLTGRRQTDVLDFS
ncbi:unnamed protein product [Schistocephalus solidus]|uniref:Uncharacterized protein n=1 Tax=Schistocephalus solidus TaxID=70667 RepID=A0A183T8H7_SCHSO|nr:unnamed protein product [Schistocephalus solidus]